MLIHLCPKFLLDYSQLPDSHHRAKGWVHLEHLTIPELGLSLTNGKDLTTRHPYPNKRYYVGCRRVGQKAQNGILIETKQQIREFTAIMSWRCQADDADYPYEHVIHYRITDNEHDTVSDDPILWQARAAVRDGKSVEAMPRRAPPSLANQSAGASISIMPMMESIYPTTAATPRAGTPFPVHDRVVQGMILRREQTMELPTIERERMTQPHALLSRVPPLKDAFIAP